jgi:Icc-related predicted phosphoesterase
VATPIGAAGEVTEELMEAKLEAIGEVEVLCSHLPPSIDPLRTDVITGRGERGSRPLLDYIRRRQPRYHFFGDVHQPQASTWRVGKTTCRNLGYFRATKRAVSLDTRDRP